MKKSIIDKMIDKQTNFEMDYSKIKDKLDLPSKTPLMFNKVHLYSLLATSFVVVLAVVLVFSLKKPSYEKTMIMKNSNTPYQYSTQDDSYGNFAKKVSEFELSFASSYLNRYGKAHNDVCSPGNLVNVMALALECSNDKARSEILTSFGLDYDSFYNNINTYINDYKKYKIDGTSLELSNSLWLDNDASFNESCISRLASNYETSSFYLDFSNTKQSSKIIKEYIADSTKNVIKHTPELNPETLCVLMSVLYLKDMWNRYGRDLNLAERNTFTNYDLSSVTKDYYSQGFKAGKAYKSQMFTACRLYLLNTTVTFFIPNDGYTTDDLIESRVLEQFNDMKFITVNNQLKENYFTEVIFPEFNVNSVSDLTDLIKEDLNINSIFQNNAFSRLSDNNIFASGVKHLASIDLNKKGIEGAAVIYIPGVGDAGPNEYKDVYETIYVNKPFLFNVTTQGTTIKSDNYEEITIDGITHKVNNYYSYPISLFSGVINYL